MKLYKWLHYNVFPFLLIVIFTCIIQVIAHIWSGQPVTWENVLDGLSGNSFSWCAVSTLFLWGLVWLWIPGRVTKGPVSPEGEIPEYKDNGVSYYFATIGVFLILEHYNNELSELIYTNMPQILGTLNSIAFLLCLYLYFFAVSKNDSHLPKIYCFYRGRDLHPKLFGVQVKQLVNCRIGLILWQILPLSFFIASYKQSMSFNFPSFVTLILQSMYLFKFYTWEAGYFHTLDIILDRAGYYICWGCLVWVPCGYTSASYYFVKHPPEITNFQAILCASIGLLAICLQYKVDMQKLNFRSKKHDFLIWGKKPTFIAAKTKDPLSGEEKSRDLLTSGYWGIARHLNYTLEIVIAFSWCIPGCNYGFLPFLYPIFLTILLIHRIFRDEEKCRIQYGKYWEEYCIKVPYRLIPYVF